MSCGACGKARSHLPKAIRARLEEVERRIAARRRPPSIAITYTTTTPTGRAASPRQLPASPLGGDGAEGQT
jgi:hypothetical protein